MATTNNQVAPSNNNQLTIADRMNVVIKGNDGKDITITKKILMDTICKGMSISDSDMVQFLTLCQVNQLNPFVRDCYLVKYQGTPSQMITSKDAFFKRADNCPDYDGLESGIIAMNGDGVLQDFVGAFMPPTWTLLGAWCKVYRKNRKPTEQRVNFSEYNKGKSTWSSMPLTMIQKVAEVQTLRKAFPNQLGKMYVSEEFSGRAEEADVVEISSEINAVENAEKQPIAPPPVAEEKPKEQPQPSAKKEQDIPDF